MRMKKKSANKTLLLVLPALLLSGCGKSLSRLDAATLLGNVVSYVGSSEFETPKSWTIEETGKGKLSNGSLSYEGSFSSAHHYSEEDHYFHSTLSVEGKVGAALSLKYTSEEWIYIDLMTVSGAKVYPVVEAAADGIAGTKNYVMTYYSSLEQAITAFNAKSDVIEEQSRLKDLSSVPSSLKDQLSSIDKSAVVSETYSTSAELSLIANLTYKEDDVSKSEKITIKEGFLQNVAQDDGTLSLTTAYNWNLSKSSKPDLGSYSVSGSPSLSKGD